MTNNGAVVESLIDRHGKVKQSPTKRPHKIHPHAVYTVPQAIESLQLRASSVRRELRERRLRVAKRCGRYYLLGEWLLEWLRAGEVRQG